MDLDASKDRFLSFLDLLDKVHDSWLAKLREEQGKDATKTVRVGEDQYTLDLGVLAGQWHKNEEQRYFYSIRSAPNYFIVNLMAIMSAVEGKQEKIPSDTLFSLPCLTGFGTTVGVDTPYKKRSLKEYHNPNSMTVKHARALMATVNSVLRMASFAEMPRRITVKAGGATVVFTGAAEYAPLNICLNNSLLTWPNGRSDRWKCEPIEELMEIWTPVTEALKQNLEEIAIKVNEENDKVIKKLKHEFASELLIEVLTNPI